MNNTNQTNQTPKNNLQTIASLGAEVENFILNNRVGKHLIECAHRARVDALENLANVNPLDSETIASLQWQARIPDLILTWLDEAMAEGEAAEESLRVEDYYQQN